MAHSNVHLANIALIRLGEQPITSLTENSRRARLANQLFETVRDSVLSENQWNAATKRAILAELTEQPLFGFNRAFQLPSDFLRLTIPVEDERDDMQFPFRIEGRTLVTDEANVKIRYVFNLKDPTRMDEFLKQAITTRLSAELSLAITGSETKFRAMWALYGQAIGEARFHDAIQSPVETIGGTQWLNARFQTGFGRDAGIELGV